MRRKFLWTRVVLVLGLLLVSQAVFAQVAELPKPQALAKDAPVPDAVQAAIALNNSLTDGQRAAIAATLAKYVSELQAFQGTLEGETSISRPARGSKGSLPGEDELNRERVALGTVLQALKTGASVQAKIDQDLKGILTEDQWAKHRVAVPPINTEAVLAMTDKLSKMKTEAYSPSKLAYCYDAAVQTAIGHILAYESYLYGYYNYVTYGDTYAYNGYYYGYNGYYYANLALANISAAYFYLTQWDSDTWGFISKAYSYLYNAYYYAYYGYYYSYYSYYYYGHTYAYYSYYYGYNAYGNLQNAYDYAYYAQ